MKNYLIIHQDPPVANFNTEETLELVLSIASLGNKVSLLLLQDAALILLMQQNYIAIERKLLHQTVAALNLFELDKIYLEATLFKKLLSWNLSLSNYNNINLFYWKDLNNLYKNHDIILSF